ncbi:MAG: HD-GYP domain-containing protein, partial [Myxococcales bacterium]
IGIIEPILCKRTRLTDEEMAVMREHPAIGGTIIEAVSFLRPVLAAVRNHHERWDGNGYPDRLKGEEIPLIARIVNCADTWDACTSTRPYQKAMPPEKALEIIRKLSGSQLDPKVAEAMERVVQKKLQRGERVSAWTPGDDELPADAPKAAAG